MNPKFVITACLLLAAAGCFWLWWLPCSRLSDFGLNAFTETLGLILTVLLVDTLLRRHEKARLLPQMQTAYEDVRLLVSRIILFWSEIYRLSVPEPCPADVNALLSPRAFEQMLQSLNMNADANVTPRRSWFEAFPQGIQDHLDQANMILQRHSTVLDPEAYRCVHSLTRMLLTPQLMAAIRQSDREHHCPRPAVLQSYFALGEDYLDSINTLVAWCKNQKNALERQGAKGLYAVHSTVGPWELNSNPPSMISPTDLANQREAMRLYQTKGH